MIHSSKTYTIFWQPSGTYLPANYRSEVAQYFTDVGADSWKTSNVYAGLTQYCSGVALGASSCGSASKNFSSYNVSYGGSTIDTAAFPSTSNCPNYALGSGYTTTTCLTDAQVQSEVNKIVAAKNWKTGLTTEFFVFTPAYVGECFTAGGTTDPQGGCYDAQISSGGSYCAYHSNIGGTKLYAFQPWGDISGCLFEARDYPNDDGADTVVNLVSHEHNETISDPLGTAWFDRLGYENGDECAWLIPITNYNGLGDYSQVINGDDYLMQGEWSNRAGDCVLKNTYAQPTASFTSAVSGLSVTFSLSRSDSDDSSFRYSWNFGDGTTSNAQSPSHTYTTAGAKNVSVTVFDAHGDQAHVAHVVNVS